MILTDPAFWASLAPAFAVALFGGGLAYLAFHPVLVLRVLKSPTLVPDIVLALVTALFLLLLYVYILRPQVRINTFTRITQKCPDRWAFNESTHRCEPRYTTSCKPFDPDTLKSYGEQCDFASACGTTWGGQCS